jgi:hypothetical protein
MISRRTVLGPVLIVLVVLIGFPAYWLYAASFAESALRDWIQRQRDDGYEIGHGVIDRSGFPMLIRLRLPSPRLALPAAGWSWRSDDMTLELQPWDLWRFRIESSGSQLFRLKIGDTKTTVRSGKMDGIAAFRETGAVRAFSLAIGDLQVSGEAAGEILRADRVAVDVIRADQDPITHTEKAFDLSLLLEKAQLAKSRSEHLGPQISTARIDAEFRGPFMSRSWRGAVDTWRRSGGTVEIRWLNLVWGALDLRANGTAALDPKMRPLGALTADIRGFAETLDALAEARLVRRDILPAARVTLNLLAKKDDSDGRRVLTVPVTAQNGSLYLGPIKLADLPSLLPPE